MRSICNELLLTIERCLESRQHTIKSAGKSPDLVFVFSFGHTKVKIGLRDIIYFFYNARDWLKNFSNIKECGDNDDNNAYSKYDYKNQLQVFHFLGSIDICGCNYNNKPVESASVEKAQTFIQVLLELHSPFETNFIEKLFINIDNYRCPWKEIETQVLKAVFARFGTGYNSGWEKTVKPIDARMLATEKRDLMPASADTTWGMVPEHSMPFEQFEIHPQTWQDAEKNFLWAMEDMGLK